jgi:oxalate decarboxylase/phosphoglucose isomerase-like protein (cupin superfamily)
VGYIDAAEASPDVYKVLFENEAVRVIEMTLKAGQTDNQHSHRDETVYFITGSKVKISLPDGNSMEADIPDGHVMWHEEWTHIVSNIGDKDLRAIVVEKQ